MVGEIRETGVPRYARERLREAEVEDLHLAGRADLDIGRLEIPMDHALLVRGFERFRDLPCNRQRFLHR